MVGADQRDAIEIRGREAGAFNAAELSAGLPESRSHEFALAARQTDLAGHHLPRRHDALDLSNGLFPHAGIDAAPTGNGPGQIEVIRVVDTVDGERMSALVG